MQRMMTIWITAIGVLACVYFGNQLLAQGATSWSLTGFLVGGLVLGASFGKWHAARATPIAA